MLLDRVAAAKWPGLPLPAELKFSVFCRSWLSRLPKLFIPVLGFTPSSRPEEVMITTGLRSEGLNGMAGYRCGLMVKVVSMPNSTVWPSAGALATTAAPTLPPAPGLLSTTKDCLSVSCSTAPTERARIAGPAVSAGHHLGGSFARARSAAAGLNLDPAVGRARAGGHRVRSAFTKKMKVIGTSKSSVHEAFSKDCKRPNAGSGLTDDIRACGRSKTGYLGHSGLGIRIKNIKVLKMTLKRLKGIALFAICIAMSAQADVLLEAAHKGEAAAQFRLGRALLEKAGEGLNEGEALRWLSLAAEQGHAEAQFTLGLAYKTGKAIQKDDREAAKWLRLAAEQGWTKAQLQMAQMYGDGSLGAVNWPESNKWLERAAEQGDADAQYGLAKHYYGGVGRAIDDVAAASWFLRAAEQGHAGAQRNLAGLLQGGIGVQADQASATKWMRRAAEGGNSFAQNEVGMMYLRGYQEVEIDYVQAVKYFQLAAAQGFDDAQFNLGAAYYFGRGVDQSYETAIAWFLKAAKQGHLKAQVNVGGMYYNGRGVTRDFKQASEWYQRAAAQGDGN